MPEITDINEAINNRLSNEEAGEIADQEAGKTAASVVWLFSTL